MIDTNLGGPIQCAQGHLSVWVNLCVIISQACLSSIGMTYSSDAIDDGTEGAKGLAIPGVDGIQLGHSSAYEIG